MKQNAFGILLVGNRVNFAPDLNEVEVSVFGPGYGESILLHVGANNWLIIDSCIDLVSREPVPLTYLRRIGVDPAEAVKQVIATHWHDDHIRGLGRVVKECKSAEFVCSVALRSTEFLALISAYGTHSMMESPGVQEFNEVIGFLSERAQFQGSGYVPPKFANADRCLWQGDPSDSRLAQPCAVHALSPSDASFLLAQREIYDLIPKEKDPKKRVFVQSPNNVAVVLWVNVGDIFILLGSELEEPSNPRTGWSAIIGSRSRPQGKASVFKIPHHGSKTADQPRVWTEMLDTEPKAVLTPFVRGNVSLPTRHDVDRICSRTNGAYATAVPEHGSTTKRPKVVEKQVREMVRSLRPVHYSTGQVRLRANVGAETVAWTVELFESALPLDRLYAA